MTDKRPTPDETAGKGRRKRTAPTIDLTATEVPPAASEAPSPPPPETPVDEPAAAAQEPPRAEAPPADKRKESVLTMPVVAAGIAGAAAMSLVMMVLWLTGLVPIRYAGSTALRARVTGLEMQLQDLQKRPVARSEEHTSELQSQR